MQFKKEWDELVVKPTVYRDENCRWSTPYDMIANSIMEEQRNRHASCRMGIWNTIKRYRETHTLGFDRFVYDFPINLQIEYLQQVKSYYDKIIGVLNETWRPIWENPVLMIHFINDCKFMAEHTIKVSTGDEILLNFENYIFENGQGLLLSDTGKDTVDTTPSNTGIHDSEIIMNQIGLTSDNCDTTIHYVTRPYLTRHGDGDIHNESRRWNLSRGVMEDRTNHYNDGQGDFRYGKLDIDELKKRVYKDANGNKFKIELTHCDEMDRVAEFNKVFENVITYDSPKI